MKNEPINKAVRTRSNPVSGRRNINTENKKRNEKIDAVGSSNNFDRQTTDDCDYNN